MVPVEKQKGFMFSILSHNSNRVEENNKAYSYVPMYFIRIWVPLGKLNTINSSELLPIELLSEKQHHYVDAVHDELSSKLIFKKVRKQVFSSLWAGVSQEVDEHPLVFYGL